MRFANDGSTWSDWGSDGQTLGHGEVVMAAPGIVFTDIKDVKNKKA